MQLNNNYKVIFIDWNGTLSTSKFWGHLQEGTAQEKEMFEKIETALFKENRALIYPWMKGEIDTNYVVNTIAKASGLKTNRVMEEFIKSCTSMKLVGEKIPSLIEILQDEGIKVVIATDNMDSFQKWTVPALSLHKTFDEILDSYSLKAMKGDFSENGKSLFFNAYFEKHQIKPEETIIIDDSEDKNNKIQNYGIDYYKIEQGIGLLPALEHIHTTMFE